MDRLQSITVFTRVTELGNFTAAAQEFRISPTMVGQHVRSVEAWLGGRLLNRTTRRQSLTELGRLAYERCRKILSDLDEVEALGAFVSTNVSGHIRVMTPVSFGAHALAPIIKTYLTRYPEVQVELVVGDKIADVIESGADVVVRVGSLADSTMISRTLGPYRSILCASPAYLRERGYPLRPDDLKNHACIGFANPIASARWRLSGPDGESTVPVAIALSANSGEALRQAALSGLGLIMQPEILVAHDLQAGRLIRILDTHEADVRPTQVMWHSDRKLAPKIRTFVDFIIENFGESLVRPMPRA
ncbi:hypothetical protein ASC97_28935 [Rhizobium sp. Root1203]|uniref:LysR family transcriptional regulator n=1 Tax=Rhizobium sp. Root1203 TaxID=1736427 RepID=UPI00070C6BF7|nr:LysR family transcriptional regulator [Rhizobium sp. Root1203]KQV19700.1 hypothetical protein ASC97_28935 [Rhizobium sp. Root1203]